MDSSITAPKMMFASSWDASWISFAASSTSCRVMSGPPVKLISTPRAPSIERSSRSGFEIAARAASTARASPRPRPVPIRAMPISFMIVRTSLKSRLIRPWPVIRSEMPRTAPSSTSSARRKASFIRAFLPATASRRWFGMVISVSTTRCSSSSPRSACLPRTRPSKRKGFVTTATVRAPTSRATSAMTGAAPVPVPPPRPAVTNTMSAPISSSRIRSRASRAASRPFSGFAPQPRPRVTSEPSWMRTGARLCWSAWASVFAATNSTPDSPEAIIVLRALPPPPPTPRTLITACSFELLSKSSRSSAPSSGPISSSSKLWPPAEASACAPDSAREPAVEAPPGPDSAASAGRPWVHLRSGSETNVSPSRGSRLRGAMTHPPGRRDVAPVYTKHSKRQHLPRRFASDRRLRRALRAPGMTGRHPPPAVRPAQSNSP
jgi:hypothetical protein